MHDMRILDSAQWMLDFVTRFSVFREETPLSMSILWGLPDEITRQIGSYLDGYELLRLSHTNRRAFHLLQHDHNWSGRLLTSSHNSYKTAKERYLRSKVFLFTCKDGGSAIGTPSLGFTSRNYLVDQKYAFSFDMWFSLTDSNPNDHGGVLLGAQDTDFRDPMLPDSYAIFAHIDSHLQLHCSCLDQEANAMITKSPLAPGVWYHVTLTYFNGKQCVYLNGNLVKTNTGKLNPAWASLYYMQLGQGCRLDMNDQEGRPKWHRFGGLLNDFRIWTVELTADNAQKLYLGDDKINVAPRFQLQPQCTQYWKFNVSQTSSTRPLEKLAKRAV